MFHALIKNLFYWRDIVEIIFFATIIYHASVWMSKDRQKNLLGYFYSYLIVLLTAYHFNIPTLYSVLLIAFPVACMIFIIAHQDILQRNFVALRAITPAVRPETGDWLETLMRSFLVAGSDNKEIICVVENNDSLENLITTEHLLNVGIKKNILELIIASALFDSKKMLWITAHGSIRGMNAHWQDTQENWPQQAVYITAKTDAVVFAIVPSSRTFTIIANGQTYSNISALHAISTIKKYLLGTTKGDITHAGHKKSHAQQPNA